MDGGQEFAEFRALSPGFVTPDEVPKAQNLSLWLDVNGERMQTGSTKSMIFCVAHLALHAAGAGDEIAAGTPPVSGSARSRRGFRLRSDEVRASR